MEEMSWVLGDIVLVLMRFYWNMNVDEQENIYILWNRWNLVIMLNFGGFREDL